MLRHAFLHIWQSFLDGGFHQLVHYLAGDASVLEFFRARIYSGHAACASGRLCRSLCWGVDFRMHDVDSPVKCCRLAEKYEFKSRLELFEHPFYAFEEDELELAGPVTDPCAHPFLFDDVDPQHLCLDLDVSHVRSDVRDTDE